MKIKNFLCSFLITTIALGSVSVFAASASNRWTTAYSTFAGYLNTYTGHRAQASTTLESREATYKSIANRSYAYLEAVDSNGYRIYNSNVEAYGDGNSVPSTALTTTIYVSNAAYFNSRHTTDLDNSAGPNGNHYFQLSAQ